MRMSQNQLLLQHHAWKMSRSSVKSERSTAQLCNFTIRIVGNCPWIAGDVREISHVWALCRESHKFHESAMWLKQEVGKAQRRKANNNTTTETKTKSTRPPKWAVHRSLASFFFLPIVRFISVKLNIFFHPTFLLSLLLACSCVDFAAAPEHGQNERDSFPSARYSANFHWWFYHHIPIGFIHHFSHNWMCVFWPKFDSLVKLALPSSSLHTHHILPILKLPFILSIFIIISSSSITCHSVFVKCTQKVSQSRGSKEIFSFFDVQQLKVL